jgi:hypothetical protein
MTGRLLSLGGRLTCADPLREQPGFILNSTERADEDRQRLVRGQADGERRRFCLGEGGAQTGDQMDEEGGNAAVAGVVTLGNILELIVNRFDQGARAA